MAGYRDDEIEATVSKFVKSSLKTYRDPLGPVDVSTSFLDVLQLLSSTLLLDPNAIFYLISLATNKLNVVVETLLDDVANLTEAIDEVSRRTTEVTHSSLLGDAAAALLEVDAILTQKNAISSRAFSRYIQAINTFIAEDLAPNIRHAGQIKRPAPLAKSEARDVMARMETAYKDMLSNLGQIELMLSEFMALNLNAVAIRDSVRQARADLDELQTYYESSGYSKNDKIGKTRETYLRLTSGKSVLSNLKRVVDPTDPRMLSAATVKGFPALPQGEGTFTAAKVTTTKSAPWLIMTGVNDQLSIQEDDAVFPTTYTLIPPPFPNVQNIIGETYNIHGDTYASITSSLPENYTIAPGADWFVVDVALPGQSLSTFSGQIAAGVYSGATLAAAIAANVQDDLGNPLSSVVAVTYAGGIKLQHLTAGDDALIVVGQKLDAFGVPIDINAVIGVTSGDSATGGSYANDGFQLDSGSVGTLPHGSAITAAQLKTFIDTYSHGVYPVGTYEGTVVSGYLKITKKLAGQTTLTVTAPASTDRARVLAALNTLGFYEGQSDSSLAMSATEVAEALNAVGKVKAVVETTKFESGLTGTITSATTMTVPLGSIDTSVAHADDQLLLTTGPSAGYHRIVSVVGTLVTVSSSTPFLYGGSPEPNQSWRIIREALQIISDVGNDLSTKIDIKSATANSTLGLTVGAVYGTTTGFVVKDTTTSALKSFTQANVVKKDILYIIQGTTRTAYTTAEVSTDGTQLELTTGISTNLADLDFQIVSAASYSYSVFLSAVAAWREALQGTRYATDLRELSRVMNLLLTPARPTQAYKMDAYSALSSLSTILSDLRDILVAFVVDPVSRIDSSLKMLKERSLDRAYDLLLSGYVNTVFNMTMDDASRSAYMLKTMRSITQKDLAISSQDEYGDDDRFTGDFEDTDADYDSSDADTDENLSILGEVGYYFEKDKTASTKGF